jgi:hypothetical protein
MSTLAGGSWAHIAAPAVRNIPVHFSFNSHSGSVNVEEVTVTTERKRVREVEDGIKEKAVRNVWKATGLDVGTLSAEILMKAPAEKDARNAASENIAEVKVTSSVNWCPNCAVLKDELAALQKAVDTLQKDSQIKTMRLAVQDLNSIFLLQNHFKAQGNKSVSLQLRGLNNLRVNDSHYILFDSAASRPLSLDTLDTYNPAEAFDGKPILCWKLKLLRDFINGPTFPDHIRSALGAELFEALRNYTSVNITDELLVPMESIDEEQTEELTSFIDNFFSNIPEFPRPGLLK